MALGMLSGVAAAAITTFNQSWMVNSEIPEANFGGLALTSFAIILNRVGRTAANPAGGSSVGLNLNFSDSATGDVHTTLPSGSAFVTGNFQPDGRNVDPNVSLDTTARTTTLSSFNGLGADRNWTLYIADAASADVATLDSWALSITGTAVPEPSSAICLALAGLLLAGRRSRDHS